MNHRRILKIIKTIRKSIAGAGATYIYTHGSCYQFYLILKSIIPNAEAYYNSDHIITKIGERFYDIRGEIINTGEYLYMKEHYPDTNLKPNKIRVEFFDEKIMKKMRKEQKLTKNN